MKALLEDIFVARNEWFLCFKAHMNLHDMKVRGDVVSADEDAAKEFLETLKEIINESVFAPTNIHSGRKCQIEPASARRRRKQ